MPSRFESLKPAMPILIGASLMLTFAMGLRQSLGIFMPDLTKGIGISVSDFTLAIAVQNLLWGVLRQALAVVAAGITVGLAGALAASRLLASLLFEVSPTDPAVFAAIASLLLAVASAAAFLPARRATRADPMVAIRAE